MIKNYKTYGFLLLYSLSLFIMISVVNAEIIEIRDISIFEEKLREVDTDCLIILDVDDVLIYPKDQLLRSQNKTLFNELYEESKKKYNLEEVEEIWSIAWDAHDVNLVDTRLPRIIIDAQNRDLHIIALTKANSGSYGKISSIEKHRVDMLKRVNIWLQHNKNINFNDAYRKLRCTDSINNPSYYEGVIFTCGINKDIALDIYLKNDLNRYKKIIFLDDKYENLKHIESYCQKKDIQFIGFHYTAVQNLPKNNIDIDAIKTQVDILQKKRIWLNDRFNK